jgi:hypothetical protein
MLAHIIGMEKYEKILLEVDTVLSKKSNLKRKVVNVLFRYLGCGLYLIYRPVVRPSFAPKNIHHRQTSFSLEYRLE